MRLTTSAVLYDSMNNVGGAEAVLFEIADTANTNLVCVYSAEGSSLDKLSKESSRVLRRLGSPIKNPFFRNVMELLSFRHRTKFLKNYSVVFFTGFNCVTAVSNCPSSRRILYCHTPPRFLYDLKSYWLSRSKIWERPFLILLIWIVGKYYEPAVAKMDIVIANSETVRKRLKKYLSIESIVIHPPCDITKFHWAQPEEFYLSTARLAPFKRVDLIVSAFVQMPDKKLVVASGGSELESLKCLAGGAKNIVFTSWLEDSELVDLMSKAIATVYIALEEDFGISPVESMAAGKPVIGVKEGGVEETVVDGETGILLPVEFAESDLIAAVQLLTAAKSIEMKLACQKRAQLYSKDIFRQKILEVMRSEMLG